MPETALLLGATSGLLGAQLVAITRIDLATLRIPDLHNALLLATGLAAAWLLDLNLVDRAIAAVAGFAALALLADTYFRVRGRDGLGLGDAKLLGAGGAWVGLYALPFSLLFAASSALAFVALQRLRGKAMAGTTALAFGPFLAAGLFLVWCVQRFL